MPELSSVSVLGQSEHPFSGRVWQRNFPHGSYEVLYKSHGKGPSDCERINAWLEDSGSDNRVSPSSMAGSRVKVEYSADPVVPEVKESNQDRVKRRARQKLRWHCKCIGADRLLSLTFRENVSDYLQAEKVLTRFLALCRREWGASFRFVAVPELQKRGAWHFHLALRGFWNINKIRGFWWRALGAKVVWSDSGKPVLRDVTETPGNVDITTPRRRGVARRAWDIDRLAGYLAKYVGKALAENDLGGKPSYRSTRGLHPRIDRYIVRALNFQDVVSVFLEVASPVGTSPYIFQSPDRSVLWAAGSLNSA